MRFVVKPQHTPVVLVARLGLAMPKQRLCRVTSFGNTNTHKSEATDEVSTLTPKHIEIYGEGW